MQKVVLIALAGALGTLARYWLTGAVQMLTARFVDRPLPTGTLAVNAIGSFAIGVLMALFAGPLLIAPQYRLALTIGFLGGFTTFSSFAYETLALTNDRQFTAAIANFVLNNALALAGVWLGYRLTHQVYGTG